MSYPYVWTWRYRRIATPYPVVRPARAPWFGDGIDRTGQRCRVVCRGTMNSAMVEFEDGHQTVTSRGGLRRVTR
jgi:hypothetical protein